MSESAEAGTPQLYERRLIAFIDILGWSEAVKNASPTLAAATEAIHEVAASHSRGERGGILADTRFIPNPLFMSIHYRLSCRWPEFIPTLCRQDAGLLGTAYKFSSGSECRDLQRDEYRGHARRTHKISRS